MKHEVDKLRLENEMLQNRILEMTNSYQNQQSQVNDYAEHIKIMQREPLEISAIERAGTQDNHLNSHAEDLLFEERREREKKLKGLLLRQLFRNKFNKNRASKAKGFALLRGYAIGSVEAAQLDNSAAMSENRMQMQD